MKKFALLIATLFILVGCASGLASPDFKKKLNHKPTATLVAVDAHIITVDSNKTYELYDDSLKASNLLNISANSKLASSFIITSNKGGYCPFVETDKGTDETSCSILIRDLRKSFFKYFHKHNIKNATVKTPALPQNSDVTVYIIALTPERTTAAVIKDSLISIAFGALTGFMPIYSYNNKMGIMIIDNHTRKVLWLDYTNDDDMNLLDKESINKNLDELLNDFNSAKNK